MPGERARPVDDQLPVRGQPVREQDRRPGAVPRPAQDGAVAGVELEGPLDRPQPSSVAPSITTGVEGSPSPPSGASSEIALTTSIPSLTRPTSA